MSSEIAMTLEDAVAEVIGYLEGIDLQLVPEHDRFQSITRQINRALRSCALENEWSYYSDLEHVATISSSDQTITLRRAIRPRVTGDDAVQLCKPGTLTPLVWAYFLPRDAIHKYNNRDGLKVSYTRQTLMFSRPFYERELGLDVYVPVMREPKQFRLPRMGQPVPEETLEQLVDFDYPDLIIMRAAYFYAQTDPILQPRVQTLEANYKELMYALVERDTRSTDAPYQNDYSLGIQSGIGGQTDHPFGRPVADDRNYFQGYSHG